METGVTTPDRTGEARRREMRRVQRDYDCRPIELLIVFSQLVYMC